MNTGDLARWMVAGPLEPFEMPFRAELARQGYTSRSTRDLVGSMARLSRWLQKRALSAGGLTPHVVAEVWIAQLGTVLRFLWEIGEVPPAHSAVGATPVEALLSEFRAWLAGERGLSAATVCCYSKQARTFLAYLPEPLTAALQRLDAGQVMSFMLGYCRDPNTESAKAAVTAVRALLRFLHVAGQVPVPLAGRCRPWPGGGWRRCPAGWTPLWCSSCWTVAIGTRSWAGVTTRS